MKQTISIRLFNTLQKGKEQLSKEALERITCFVESQRMEEESFVDKSGNADLYYTVFGWMLCTVLGIKLDPKKTGAYLESQDADSLDLIHYAAFMRCRMMQRLIEGGKMEFLLKSFFSTEIKALGGFHSLPHNDPHSPYTQFIWISLMEDTGNRIKDKKEIIESLLHYRLNGGGYMNTTDGLTATTNATVAALAIRGQVEEYRENADVRFLQGLQKSSGGFGAVTAAPVPDLLSTATALFMLGCYKMQPKYPARDFIEAHWLNSGGFSATLMDDLSDVEYTFYGLLALGATYRGTKKFDNIKHFINSQ